MSLQSHDLIRTSPRGHGQKFVGKCQKCGAEGLTFADLDKPCDNPHGMTQDESLLRAIDPPEDGDE